MRKQIHMWVRLDSRGASLPLLAASSGMESVETLVSGARPARWPLNVVCLVIVFSFNTKSYVFRLEVYCKSFLILSVCRSHVVSQLNFSGWFNWNPQNNTTTQGIIFCQTKNHGSPSVWEPRSEKWLLQTILVPGRWMDGIPPQETFTPSLASWTSRPTFLLGLLGW